MFHMACAMNSPTSSIYGQKGGQQRVSKLCIQVLVHVCGPTCLLVY